MDTGVEVASGMVEDKCVRGSGSIVWDGVGVGGGSGRAGTDLAEGEGVAKAGGGKRSVSGEGFLTFVPSMNLGILDNLMITDANIGLTDISPRDVLQCGREEMHAASTTFCSVTLRVFQMILAASKSNSCPGCKDMCLYMEFSSLRSWISSICSLMRTSKGLDVRP